MSEFQKVAKVDEISDPGKELVEVDDTLVVVFHVNGAFYCLDDICTHDGGTLGDGELHDCKIACPRHGAEFDIKTGAALSMPATEPTLAHEVKVEDGFVWVKLNDGSEPAPIQQTAKASDGNSPAASQPSATPTTESSTATESATSEPTKPVARTGPLHEDHVREALKQVIDPELFVNIVDLGLIYVVDLEDTDPVNVKVEMTMTSPMCPAGPQLVAQTKQVVEAMEDVGTCEVKVVMDPPWTPDRMTDEARDHLGIF